MQALSGEVRATTASLQLLDGDAWRGQAAAHEARADAMSAGRRSRGGRAHPVEDFLWTYYSLRPGRLRRWNAGVGVGLLEVDDVPTWHRVAPSARGPVVTVDVEGFLVEKGALVEWVHAVLGGVASRPARHDCFGLHEWAMVYRADETRHPVPLRLGAAGTDAVVEASQLRCSHIDAFRFFTEPAVPLNAGAPTRAAQPDTDQAGCIHVSMDLLKWALKLGPLVPGELLLDCFELARDARTLDMRASPYELSGLGYDPVPIETAAGRAEYAAAQRALSVRAAPLRERLLVVCRAALERPDVT